MPRNPEGTALLAEFDGADVRAARNNSRDDSGRFKRGPYDAARWHANVHVQRRRKGRYYCLHPHSEKLIIAPSALFSFGPQELPMAIGSFEFP